MGRTHSVHAEPTTFGLKLAGWAFEVDRGRRRLAEAVDEIATGKISGPVGTYSHLGPDIEAEVLAELDLHVDPVEHPDRPARPPRRAPRPRSRSSAAASSGSRPRSGTSSTPRSASSRSRSRPARRARRRCPTSATRSCRERIAGLARAAARLRRHGARGPAALARARHQPHLGGAGDPARRDDPARLHARPDDRPRSTASSSGRSGCARTSSAGLGLHASSRVLVALVERGGLSREDAYAIVQRAALPAADERRPLRDLLAVDPTVAARSPSPTSTPASTTPAFLRHVPDRHRPPRQPGGSSPCRPLARLAGYVRPLRQGPRPLRARRRPAAARRVGPASARSTSSCRPRSPTRAAC